MSKLLKLAVASWRRQKLRTAMTVGSLALSVGAVVFVYSLSVAFESSGSQAIEQAIGKADIWVVPAKGVEVNRKDERIDALGKLPSGIEGEIDGLPGVTGVTTVTGSGEGTLQVSSSDPKATAAAMKQSGLTVTSDPGRTIATAGAPALAYLITASSDRFGAYSFAQQFEAVQVNEVASSVLGVVGRVTLALGFLAVLTSLLISIDERRREFGILAAVGITDDVLYLFLVESGLLIALGLVVGVIFGGGMFALLLPSIFALGTVGKAVALVSVYFPIMLILGALIPAWRLLQKSPLELLRSSP
ncbi:MAG: ABC transporter permease [Solirubrobacterales bacterium]|nr:ABC transporter permease [Solirubrobacterales bacterium]